MAELFGSDDGDADALSAAADTGSAASAVALGRLRRRKSSAAETAEQRFLAEQSALITDQRQHLHEQMRHMRLKHFGERLKVTIQLMTIVVGVAIVGSLAWMAIQAARADGVVIKPFTVAPDLARRGVTGEVVASQILDKLTDISDRSQASNGVGTFGAGWGQNISLQIPETGVSLGELDQFLRDRLGHEKRLAGEVIQNPDGTLTVVARLGARALPVQTGPASDLPALIGRTAEALYRREQPNTYVQYLGAVGRSLDEQVEVDREMTDSHNPVERATGYGGLAIESQQGGDLDGAIRYFRRADAEHAGLSWPTADIGGIEAARGQLEPALREIRQGISMRSHDPTLTPQAAREATIFDQAVIADLMRDHATLLDRRIADSLGDNLGRAGSRASMMLNVDEARARTHDGAAADMEAQAFTPREPADPGIKANQLMRIAYARGDWQVFLDRLDACASTPGCNGKSRFVQARRGVALTRLGRLADARAVIDPTPLDCQPCIIARAVLAEAAGRPAEADHWFGEASRIAPSAPTGPLYWGQALLARGDAQKAALQFREACRRSPRAEEALEGLGEALLVQGDVARAVKQYAAASALTPKWGRLHVKWGEALAKLGKRDEARAQFRAAATMDLTAAERAELAGQRV